MLHDKPIAAHEVFETLNEYMANYDRAEQQHCKIVEVPVLE
jgi:hypothetical protein